MHFFLDSGPFNEHTMALLPSMIFDQDFLQIKQ